jgi:hypothetical protein
MPQKFFDEREDQSEVKARIVTKYFYVWAKIIAHRARGQRIGYIDLFAGPGRYKDGSASTPLMVLEQAIADPALRDTLVTMFNDEDPEHTKSLASEIAKLPGIETLKYKPEIKTGNVGGTPSLAAQAHRILTEPPMRVKGLLGPNWLPPRREARRGRSANSIAFLTWTVKRPARVAARGGASRRCTESSAAPRPRRTLARDGYATCTRAIAESW